MKSPKGKSCIFRNEAVFTKIPSVKPKQAWTGVFFGYTCIDSVLTIVYHSTHRCKQKRGKGIVDSEPFRERSRQELEGSAGCTCRSRPGVVELKAEALDSAGYSRYLFKCRTDEGKPPASRSTGGIKVVPRKREPFVLCGGRLLFVCRHFSGIEISDISPMVL